MGEGSPDVDSSATVCYVTIKRPVFIAQLIIGHFEGIPWHEMGFRNQ